MPARWIHSFMLMVFGSAEAPAGDKKKGKNNSKKDKKTKTKKKDGCAVGINHNICIL